jgi:DnaJ-domain-containing protein 1
MTEQKLHREEYKTIETQIDPSLGQKLVVPKSPKIKESEVALKKHFSDVCFDSSYDFRLLKIDKKKKAKSYKNIFCFDNSIHAAVKDVFVSQINAYLKKLNYSKAILVYEEMFDNSSKITSSEINKYNKIIKSHNKLNTKKKIITKNYEATNPEEFYKSAFGKFKANQIIEILRGFNSNKYEGYSIVDLYKKTNYLCTSNHLFGFSKDNLILHPKDETKSIDIDLYGIAKDTFSTLFIIRTESKKAVLLNHELFEISSYNASSIFQSDRNRNDSINVSKSADIILLTENEEVYLFDLSFKQKSIWILPSNSTKGKFKEGTNNLDPETESHLKTLGIEGIPEKEEVKTAYKALAQIHHPDKNPENTIESGEKMKKLNVSKDYLDTIDFENYKKNNSTFSCQLIIQFTMKGILTPYEPNEVCASFIDKHNFIYLACKSGNVYVLTTSGNLISTIDFASNNKYFYSFDSIAVVNQTLVICEGEYIHLFKNNEHIKTIVKTKLNTWTQSKIKYLDNHILLYTNQSLVFYNTNGEIVDILLFNRKIRNVYSSDKRIIIEMPGKFLEFNV